MHFSPYGPAGGDLSGTFPNPRVLVDNAGLAIAARVFGQRSTQQTAAAASTGAGTVNSGTATQVAIYPSTGAAVSGTPAITVGASDITLTPPATSGLVKGVWNSTASTATGFRATNTNASGRTTYEVLNDGGVGGIFGAYGTSYPTTSYRNNFVVGGDNSVIFVSNGSVTTGGSSPIDFVAGGFGNSPTTRFVAGNPGRVLVGTTTDDGTNRLQVSGGVVDKNTTAAARGVVATVNNNANEGGVATYGTTFAVTAFQDVTNFYGGKKTNLISDANVSSGGTNTLNLIAGGYGNTPTITITAGSPGVAQHLGGVTAPIATKTAAYTMTVADFTIRADTSSASFAVTLPASPTQGQLVNVKKVASANTLTIGRNGKNIDGAAADLTVTALNTNTQLQYDATAGWCQL